MFNKKIILGVSAILIVIAILIVAEKMASVSPPEHRTKFFPAIEERHITSIVVNDGNSVIRLDKNGGEWTVSRVDESSKSESPASVSGSDPAVNAGTQGDAGADSQNARPADTALVQIAIEKIVTLKKSELISDNPDNQAVFEVDDANKSFVEVYAGKDTPTGVLRIGKNGPNWNSNYVRLAGSSAVYLIPGGLRQSLFLDVDSWLKKEEPAPESAADSSAASDGNPDE